MVKILLFFKIYTQGNELIMQLNLEKKSDFIKLLIFLYGNGNCRSWIHYARLRDEVERSVCGV